MKSVWPLLLFFSCDSCLKSLCMLVWKTQKHVAKVANMLTKSILVDYNYFIRCKCKNTHFLDSQVLSEYISTIVHDDNEKLSINEVPEFLINAGTFTSASSFNTKSLQFVTMNKLKISISGSLQFFPFYLVVPYSVCFLLEFEATSHNVIFVGK